jgi:hypothetical protein
MDDDQVAFLPYHAINEFMLDDYRHEVVSTALNALPELPEELRASLEGQIRRAVRVPGFRNSGKAPLQLKVKPTEKAFEKSAELVALVLAAWAEANPVLRQQVFDLLVGNGWEILPIEADRTQLPGWLTVWPAGQDYDVLYETFRSTYPEVEAQKNDVSLMVVWLSGRLPYHVEGEDEEEEEEDG